MSRSQKRTCRYCFSPAVISRTEWKTDTKTDVANLYVRCTNLECGHTWVENVTFSHTLVPSAIKSTPVKLLVEMLRPDEKIMLMDLLSKG
ncbi:ogr/Delta-like zinc finger family protein [Edwardsiella tarda]|uniref:ogr/Delta-like zinc finger family protein n=1 Tax=Edwardsiella tarda TaxID=636 RepID=UPI002444D0A1|nr:ogr/Delta-like zinc finger family protein [Edwardsiella tarda]WGE29430.1 ogr/Delta-like zinc finger family protein [Edwardsiella tarda]